MTGNRAKRWSAKIGYIRTMFAIMLAITGTIGPGSPRKYDGRKGLENWLQKSLDTVCVGVYCSWAAERAACVRGIQNRPLEAGFLSPMRQLITSRGEGREASRDVGTCL